MMIFLAWYTFIFMIYSTLLNIGDSKNKGGVRIGVLVLSLPIILFAAFYIFS
ncbi:hypothetical protein ACQVQR_27540 [Bacillus paranthracis]|uniref:hypothetical protein n=1 Tax=Bacillus paranthracis TaxID=2026186 RepID=UPI003D6531CE